MPIGYGNDEVKKLNQRITRTKYFLHNVSQKNTEIGFVDFISYLFE